MSALLLLAVLGCGDPPATDEPAPVAPEPVPAAEPEPPPPDQTIDPVVPEAAAPWRDVALDAHTACVDGACAEGTCVHGWCVDSAALDDVEIGPAVDLFDRGDDPWYVGCHFLGVGDDVAVFLKGDRCDDGTTLLEWTGPGTREVVDCQAACVDRFGADIVGLCDIVIQACPNVAVGGALYGDSVHPSARCRCFGAE